MSTSTAEETKIVTADLLHSCFSNFRKNNNTDVFNQQVQTTGLTADTQTALSAIIHRCIPTDLVFQETEALKLLYTKKKKKREGEGETERELALAGKDITEQKQIVQHL